MTCRRELIAFCLSRADAPAVHRVGWVALVLAVVMGVAAILQAAALLDLQASIVQSPANAPGSIQTHGLGVVVPPPWLMSIGFALTAIGCAIAGPRRRHNEPSALGGAPTGRGDLLLG